MTKKPWHSLILGSLLAASSLSIPRHISQTQNLHPLNDFGEIFSLIGAWSWGFIALSLIGATLLWKSSKHLAWAIPGLCLYTILMTTIAPQSTPILATLSVAAITVILYLPFGWLLIPQLQKGDGPTEKKGWNHPERKQVNLPMIIDAPYNQAFSVSTYDISLGGAYIRFDDVHTSMNMSGLTGPRSGLKVGDLLNLKLHAGRFSNIHCQGRVVRLQRQAKGKYPEGIGIQFLHMKKRDLRKLKMLLSTSNQKIIKTKAAS